MKKSYKSLCFLIIILTTMPMIQAQTPTDFGTTGETNTNPDDSAAPIDNYLLFLFIAGAGFGYIKLRPQLKRPLTL